MFFLLLLGWTYNTNYIIQSSLIFNSQINKNISLFGVPPIHIGSLHVSDFLTRRRAAAKCRLFDCRPQLLGIFLKLAVMSA